MKITDTILLLRNGYTKAEINALTEDDNTENLASLQAENKRLKDALEQAQKNNINNAETEKPVEKEINLNDILKG